MRWLCKRQHHLSRRLPKDLQKTSEVGGFQKLFTRVSHISNAQVCILSAELGEVYPSYSNSEKDREASEGCSWWLRSEEAVRQDDRYLWSWENVGGCLREQSTARRFSLKKGTCFPNAYYRIFYALWWEMKNWMRKWWREHDTEEFGHSIIAGTMRRMHKCSKLKGMPVCDYYTVSWISESCFDTYMIPTYGEFDLKNSSNRVEVFPKNRHFFL